MITRLKAMLFTPESVLCALLYVTCTIGAIGCWAFVKVAVLGEEFNVPTQVFNSRGK